MGREQDAAAVFCEPSLPLICFLVDLDPMGYILEL